MSDIRQTIRKVKEGEIWKRTRLIKLNHIKGILKQIDYGILSYKTGNKIFILISSISRFDACVRCTNVLVCHI